MPLAHLTAPTLAHDDSLLILAGADGPVCPAKMPPSERMLLTLNALAYHGSSALHQALMSSPQVATMCAGNHWQCEVALRTTGIYGESRCTMAKSVLHYLYPKAQMHDKLLKLKLKRGAADDKVVKAEIKAKTLAKAANKTGASKRDVMRATDAKVKAENAAQKAQAIHDYDWDPVANPYHYLMEPRVAGAGGRCFACDGQKEEKRGTPCAKRTIEERLAGDMRVFEPYWEQQPNRSTMLVKWAPLTSMGAVCPIFDIDEEAYTKDGGRAVSQLLEVPRGETRLFGTDVIPAAMRKAGVHKLRWATLFMHRPWCMWRASSHADGSISHAVVHVERGTTEDEIRGWARRELAHIEGLVLQHQKLVQRGAAVLVVNLAHLIHDFTGFNHRLREFAPCLDKLDDAFEPVLGSDIFLANQLKTGGTLKEYAASHHASSWKMDPTKLTCSEPPEKLYEGLNETEMVRHLACSLHFACPLSRPHAHILLHSPLPLPPPRCLQIRAQAAEGYLIGLSEASAVNLGAAQVAAEAARLRKLQSAQDILDAVTQAEVDQIAGAMDAKQKFLDEKRAQDAAHEQEFEKTKVERALKQVKVAKASGDARAVATAEAKAEAMAKQGKQQKERYGAVQKKLQDDIDAMKEDIEAKEATEGGVHRPSTTAAPIREHPSQRKHSPGPSESVAARRAAHRAKAVAPKEETAPASKHRDAAAPQPSQREKLKATGAEKWAEKKAAWEARMEANAARRKEMKAKKAKAATEHSTPAKDAAAKAAKEVSKQQQVHQDDDDVAARRAAHRAKVEAMQKARGQRAHESPPAHGTAVLF
jgi:hypothetical protein